MTNNKDTTGDVACMAHHLEQAGLREMALFGLHIVKPIDFLCSQMALFAVPLVGDGVWGHYMRLFGEEATWQALREQLGK